MRLGGVQDIIKSIASVDFDDAGEKITPKGPRFEEGSYGKFCEDVYDRIEILSEYDDCVSEYLKVIPVSKRDF